MPRKSRFSWYFLELRAKDIIDERGGIAIRSTRSRSPIDIIGIFPEKGEIWLIQCKMTELPRKEETLKRRFKELADLKGKYKIRVFLYGKQHGRYGMIEL